MSLVIPVAVGLTSLIHLAPAGKWGVGGLTGLFLTLASVLGGLS